MMSKGLSSISSKTLTVENQIKCQQSTGLAAIDNDLVDPSFNSKMGKKGGQSTIFDG